MITADTPTRVRKILAEYFAADEKQVADDETLLDVDLGADSLDVVEAAMAIEEEFDIIILDDEVRGFETIGDLIAFVELATAGRRAMA